MKTSQLIAYLTRLLLEHGDLPIVMMDNTGFRKEIESVLKDNGEDSNTEQIVVQ